MTWVKHVVVVFAVFLLVEPAFAAEVEATGRAAVFVNRAGKVQKVGETTPRKRYPLLGRSPDGKWAQIRHGGKPVWVSSKNVRSVAGGRDVASVEDSSDVSSSRHAATGPIDTLPLAIGVTAAFQTSSYGYALGLGANYLLPVKLPPGYRLDIGLTGYYLPSGSFNLFTTPITTTSTAIEIMGLGRLTLPVARKFYLGGEAGMVFVSVSSSVTTGTTPTSGSSSTFGAVLGGLAGMPLGSSIFLMGGLRLLVYGGTPLMAHAGVEWRF